jgi:hypothetical protein
LFRKTPEVLRDFLRLNSVVQGFAHHRQDIVKAIWQIPFGAIRFPILTAGKEQIGSPTISV